MKITSASIDIINICNLNCSTCYNRSGLNCVKKETPHIEIRHAIETLLPYGLNRVILSGGEPMLHSDFNRILDLTGEYPDIGFNLVTNGTIHNDKLFKTLAEKENLFIQVSLDGSNEEMNAKTRGKGSYDKTVEFIRNINDSKNKPLVKMVISQDNYNDVEDFYRFSVSLGCVPEFAFIFKRGNGAEHWEAKTLSAKQKLSILNLLEQLNAEMGVSAFLPLCNDSCPYLFKEPPEIKICIDIAGYIQPCFMLFEKEYRLGSMRFFNEERFFDKIIKMHTLAVKRMQTDLGCEKCVFNSTCGRGCMANALIMNGDIFADDGDCGFRKLQLFGHIMKR